MTQWIPEATRLSKTMILLAVILGLAWASGAGARPPGRGGHGPGPGPATFPDQLLEEVGVSEATREKIATISKDSEVGARDLHEKIYAAREDLRKLLDQDSPNSDLVMTKVEEIGALEIEADKHRLNTMLSIRALLTPAQRAQLAKLHDQHRGKRFGRKMHKVDHACKDTLEGVCSAADAGHERMECLHDHISEASEPCKKAMRQARRPRHPRFDSKPSDSPPEN